MPKYSFNILNNIDTLQINIFYVNYISKIWTGPVYNIRYNEGKERRKAEREKNKHVTILNFITKQTTLLLLQLIHSTNINWLYKFHRSTFLCW